MRINRIIYSLIILFSFNLLGCRSISNQIQKTKELNENIIEMNTFDYFNTDQFINILSIEEEDFPDKCEFARSKQKQIKASYDYTRETINEGFYPKFIKDEYKPVLDNYQRIISLINKYCN
tara:strand:- start:179 stop:541 length:363 start_codon:yes stop_codon:yes gene_type:complete